MTTQVFFPPFDTWATHEKSMQVDHEDTADPPLTYMQVKHASTSSNNLGLPAERSAQGAGDVERMQELVEGGGPSTPSAFNELLDSTSTHRQLVAGHASTTSSPPRPCRRRRLSADRTPFERIHKRGTSLGPLPLSTSFNTNPPLALTKTHKRTLSTATPEQKQRHTASPLRTILSDSTLQANMPMKTAAEAEVDRQRGLELVMGLMGEADLISESDDTSKEGGHKPLCMSFSPKGKTVRRKHKSADETPSRLASSERPYPLTWGQSRLQHRTRHSSGPGGNLLVTIGRNESSRPRPPPLRDLPPPSWSCPGPSPPLTSLAQPFPSEFFVVHVPSPINAVCSPPPSPFSLSSPSSTLGGNLRRRRSSLSSFESIASTIRPWDLQGEITPKPSRTQLVRLRVHEACEDQLARRPSIAHRAHTTYGAGDWKKITAQSEQEQRTNKKQRRTFEAFPAYEDYHPRTRFPTEPLSPSGSREGKSTAGRGRRRGRGSDGNASHRDVEDVRDIRSAAWWEGLGGWLGKEKN